MNAPALKGGTPHQFCTPINFKDFEVSFVAENPFQPGFSFGSDDGKIRFTDEDGVSVNRKDDGWQWFFVRSRSGEAINGIASIGNSIAVSTRQDVSLYSWPDAPDQLLSFPIPHGAHGITATPSGYYVAPLGEAGIMMFKATSRHGDSVGVLTANKNMNFYRVIAQHGRDGKDLLVSAARHGGIGITEVRWGDNLYSMRTARFPELDAIDVCFVGGIPESPAVAAVGRDGSLILVRDILHDKEPLTMKFDTIKGKAYRLLSARGHLFLLTSSALYGLMNLGKRLLEGLPEKKFTTEVLVIPLEAVDASVVNDRWLAVVMPNEVLRFDLDSIDADSREQFHSCEINDAGFAVVETTGEPVDRIWELLTIEPGQVACS